jgi:hypothetical protein
MIYKHPHSSRHTSFVQVHMLRVLCRPATRAVSSSVTGAHSRFIRNDILNFQSFVKAVGKAPLPFQTALLDDLEKEGPPPSLTFMYQDTLATVQHKWFRRSKALQERDKLRFRAGPILGPARTLVLLASGCSLVTIGFAMLPDMSRECHMIGPPVLLAGLYAHKWLYARAAAVAGTVGADTVRAEAWATTLSTLYRDSHQLPIDMVHRAILTAAAKELSICQDDDVNAPTPPE